MDINFVEGLDIELPNSVRNPILFCKGMSICHLNGFITQWSPMLSILLSSMIFTLLIGVFFHYWCVLLTTDQVDMFVSICLSVHHVCISQKDRY